MNDKKYFSPLFFTIFNDGLGYGIVLTIFPPMLLHPEFPLVPPGTSLPHRIILIGLLLSIYGLGQTIFSPLLGAISDRVGRKKVFLSTLWISAFGNAVSVFAIMSFSIPLLFISRFITGCSSANLPLAQAGISDISTDDMRSKNIGKIGIMGGVSWLLGPPIGGLLALPKFFPWFNFIFPLGLVSFFFVINALAVHKNYFEKKNKNSDESLGIKEEIKGFRICWNQNVIRNLLIIFFFYVLGRLLFLQFYPSVLVEKYGLSQLSLGLYSSTIAIFFMLGSYVYMRYLSKKDNVEKVLISAFILAGIFIGLSSYYPSPYLFFITFLVAGSGSAISWIHIVRQLSKSIGKEKQGMIFGVQQSFTSFCIFISPLIAGFMGAKNLAFPLITSGLILIFAGILYYLLVLRREANSKV